MTALQRRNWTTAGKLLLYAILVFSAATWVVARYETWIRKFNWSMVSIICGFAFVGYMFYRWNNSEENTFDPLDLFLDPFTRRLSPWRTIVLAFAAVGVWTLVQWVLKDKPGGDIINLFTVLLGAFVSKLISGDFADALAKRNPSIATDQPTQPEAPRGP